MANKIDDLMNQLTPKAPGIPGKSGDHIDSLMQGLGPIKANAPGLTDYAKKFGAEALRATGSVLQGMEVLGGTSTKNRLDGLADNLSGSMSAAAKYAEQNSQVSGDITSPSTWSAGNDPSIGGIALNAIGGAASLTPQVAAAVATRGRSVGAQTAVGAGAGVLQTVGADGGDEAQKLAKQNDAQLQQNASRYRELRTTMPEAEARSQLEKEVARGAGLAAGVTALPEEMLIGKLLHGAKMPGVGKPTGRVSAAIRGGAAGAAGEGAQEAAEGIAQRWGANNAGGMNKSITEDSFGNAVMGAMVGGPFGVAHGAASYSPEQNTPAPGAAPGVEQIAPGVTPSAPGVNPRDTFDRAAFDKENGQRVRSVTGDVLPPDAGPLARASMAALPQQPEIYPSEQQPALPRQALPNLTREGEVLPPDATLAAPVGGVLENAPLEGDWSHIDDGAHSAATSPLNDSPAPTESQQKAGNYRKGHVKLHGLDIAIEHPQASIRSGVDGDGTPWANIMPAHYGYIKRTVGNDSDQVDTFIGQNPDSTKVFVVDQVNPKTGKFDEHKVMLGFDSREAADQAYHGAYAGGWNGAKKITELNIAAFKDWLRQGNTKRPLWPVAKKYSGTVADPVRALPAQNNEQAAPNIRGKTALNDDRLQAHGGGVESMAHPVRDMTANPQNVGTSAQRVQETPESMQVPIDHAEIWNSVNPHDRAEIAVKAGLVSQTGGPSMQAKMAAMKKWEALPTKLQVQLKNVTAAHGAQDLFSEPAVVKKSLTTEIQDAEQPDSTKSKLDQENKPQPSAGVSVSTPSNNPNYDWSEDIQQANDFDQKAYADNMRKVGDDELQQRIEQEEETLALDKRDNAPQPIIDVVEARLQILRDESARRTRKQEAVSDQQAHIGDFGKKLEGAAKDRLRVYRNKLENSADLDATKEPFSKLWPEPNYQALLDDGIDPYVVAFVRSARDEIPAKPRKAWKVGGWAEKVTSLRGFASDMLDGGIKADAVREQLHILRHGPLREIVGRIELYQRVGHAHSLAGVVLSSHDYSFYDGIKYNPPKTIWTIESDGSTEFGNMGRNMGEGDTKEQAIDAFAAKYAEFADSLKPVRIGETKFEIYRRRTASSVWIVGKKVGKDYIDLATFKTSAEAEKHIAENRDALEKKLEAARAIPSERRAVNVPRLGEDYRHGANVTVEQFAEEFGFRGGQFGNSMPQNERSANLNQAYDALMDLAAIIGIPPKALSLNGELGLAFGARGKGGINAPAAHYEPDATGKLTDDTVVINLTRKNGPGSLAHEWFHAVDNYFARMRGEKGGEISERPYALMDKGVRQEMIDAFRSVMDAIGKSGIPTRSAELDGRKGRDYWAKKNEMAARSFESYIIAKLHDQEKSNDYLANIVSKEFWDAQEALERMDFTGTDKPGASSTYPYPSVDEMPAVRGAFDNFFATVKTEETPQGTTRLYSQTEQRQSSTIPEIRAAMIEAFGRRGQILLDNGSVVIVQNERDIPGEAEQIQSEDDSESRQGFFVPKTGKVYLIADGLAASDVRAVMAHEATHWLEIKSPEIMDTVMRKLQMQMDVALRFDNGAVSKWFKEAWRRVPSDTQHKHVLSEIAAYAVTNWESAPGSIKKLIQDMIAGFRMALVRMGWTPASITPADLAAMARYSIRRMGEAERFTDKSTKLGEKAFAQWGDAAGQSEVLQSNNNKSGYVAAILKMLARVEGNTGLFRYPKAPESMKSLEDVVSAVSEGMASVHETDVDGGNADKTWMISMPKGDPVFVMEKGDSVWINASALQSGESMGSLAYSIVGNYAHNAGKVFIGDPDGLSIKALFRRTEHMANLAIKFGTTKFLMPHEAQVDPNGYYGNRASIERGENKAAALAQPIKWGSDDRANLEQLLSAAYNNAVALAPGIENVRYDFDHQRFVDGSGKEFDFGAYVKRIRSGNINQESSSEYAGDSGVDSRANAQGVSGRRPDGAIWSLPESIRSIAGSTTLQRAALFHSILRASGDQVSWGRVLDSASRQLSGNQLDESLRQRFYSKAKAPSDGGFSFADRAKDALGKINQTDRVEVRGDKYTLPPVSKAENAQANLQDKFNRWKVVQDVIAKQGGKLLDKINVYLAEERYHKILASKLHDFREKTAAPMAHGWSRDGINVEQLASLLYAQHAPERNKAMQAINPNVKTGSGMSDEDAAAVVAHVKSLPNADAYFKAADQMRAISNRSLNLAVEKGVVSQEMADAFREKYKYYVPLKGWEDVDETGAKSMGNSTGRGLSVSRGLIQAVGRDSKAGMIIENIFHDHETSIARGEKNEVAQVMLGFLRANPDQALWRIENVAQKPAVGTKDGEPMVVLRNSMSLDDNQVKVFENGEQRVITFADQVLGEQYNDLGTERLPAILRSMTAYNRFLSAMYTAKNPVFIVKNMLRDIQSGTINLIGEVGLDQAMKTWKHYGGAMKAMVQYASGKEVAGDWGDWVKRYRESGGQTGMGWVQGLEDISKKLAMEYDKQTGANNLLKEGRTLRAAQVAGSKGFHAVTDLIENVNVGIENALRLAAFRQAIESGTTQEKAASLAANLTVNFDRKGKWTPILGGLFLFFNPRLQGAARVLQTMTKGIHRKQALALMGSMALASLFLTEAARGFGDDDDEEKYLNIPEGERSRNWIFMIGDRRITLPIPPDYLPFATLGKLISDVSHGKHLTKAGEQMMLALMDAAIPLTITGQDGVTTGTVAQGLIPTAGQMPIRIGMNKNGMGGDMMPGTDFMPDNQRMWNGTRGTSYDKVAQALAKVGWEVSPESMKEIVRTTTGGLGTFVQQFGDGVVNLATGKDTKSENVPMLSAFSKTESVRDLRSAFYSASSEAREELGRFESGVKHGSGADGLRMELVALGRAAEKLNVALGKQNRAMAAIRSNEQMPDDQKDKMIQQMEAAQGRMYENYLQLYRKRAELN